MHAKNIATMDEWNALLARAEALGRERGRDLAGLLEVNSRSEAAAILQGIDDDDPEVLSALPSVNLAHEWADDPTIGDLLEALGVDEDSDDGALATAYMEAGDEQVIADVECRCRAMLEAHCGYWPTTTVHVMD